MLRERQAVETESSNIISSGKGNGQHYSTWTPVISALGAATTHNRRAPHRRRVALRALHRCSAAQSPLWAQTVRPALSHGVILFPANLIWRNFLLVGYSWNYIHRTVCVPLLGEKCSLWWETLRCHYKISNPNSHRRQDSMFVVQAWSGR